MEGCSLNIFPTGLHKVLNASDADVIHLHWVNNEMISIKEIAKIKKPLVWTLHDCWTLCGAEHYPATEYWRYPEDRDRRTEVGVQRRETSRQQSAIRGQKAKVRGQITKGQTLTTSNRPPATGVALHDAVNKWIYRKKMQSWQRLTVHFVAPSNWMAEQVKKSELFADAPVTVIPNCLDLEIFQPLEQSKCRKKLGLPLDKKLILFGAFDPADLRKGGDLLEETLRQLPEEMRGCSGVVVFGCKGGREIGGLETFWMGSVGSERKMAEVYSAADVFVCPSRADNLPNTIAESLACGVPCVGFRTGGLPDMIEHEKTGWLAEPFCTEDFCRGLLWILDKKQRVEDGGRGIEERGRKEACREKAETRFSVETLVKQHQSVYKALTATALNTRRQATRSVEFLVS
jgi:glycosyltransferase involved in cell wall biosynthesis